MRTSRIAGAMTGGSLEALTRIPAAFVGDNAQTIRPLLEVFQKANRGAHLVYHAIDSTTKNSGHRDGEGATREDAIAREMRGDGFGVSIDIEDTAEPRGDDGQNGDVVAGDFDLQRVARRQVADSNQGDVVVDANDAAIDAVAHLFNAGDGTRRTRMWWRTASPR